jgi:pimeloyl-ACP methyl ester carboxylesterase
MLSKETRERDPSVAADFKACFADFDPKAASQTVRSVMTRFEGLLDVLPIISVPTVVLAGEKDKLYPVNRLEAQARRIPSANLLIATDSGHLTALETPEYIVEALAMLRGMRRPKA